MARPKLGRGGGGRLSAGPPVFFVGCLVVAEQEEGGCSVAVCAEPLPGHGPLEGNH